MNTKREGEWRQNTAVKNWWAVGTNVMERGFHNGLEPAPPKSLPTITKENETLNKLEERGVMGVEVGGGSPPSAGTALRTRETGRGRGCARQLHHPQGSNPFQKCVRGRRCGQGRISV